MGNTQTTGGIGEARMLSGLVFVIPRVVLSVAFNAISDACNSR